MRARDVMTQPVVSAQTDASILEAGELMRRHHISGLPVMDETGRLVGIVTERDFLRETGDSNEAPRPRWVELLRAGPKLAALPERCTCKVSEVMTHSPVTVGEDTPLEEVVRLMDHHRIKRVPVLRGTELVGVISRADLVRALAESLRKAPETKPEDVAFRQRMTELERHSWMRRITG
ncbi:MAG TPA: CBS domain-containing protein [Bryobacteraceae bacterium]|nr:CBS domain-containing protein [Bryobacteraceae bacterium]